VVPMQWQDNTVLTHNVHVFQEVRWGDQVKNLEERHVVQLSAVGRTAQGHVRVRLAYDGTALGDILFDEQGRVVDAFPTNPADMAEFQALVQTERSTAMQEITSKTLRRGEPVQVTVPSAPFIKMLPDAEYHGGFEESVSMELTFTGYVRLGAAHAIAITTNIAILQSPLFVLSKDKKREVWVNEVSVEEHSYYDPTGGYTLAKYRVTTMSGRVAGRAFSMRWTEYQALDRARSSGL
jgi:hypothetical protein